MKKNPLILGIETSCDETAASIISQENGEVKILSNVVSSQTDEHKKFGGVVPELAARSHLEKIFSKLNDNSFNSFAKKVKNNEKNILSIEMQDLIVRCSKLKDYSKNSSIQKRTSRPLYLFFQC